MLIALYEERHVPEVRAFNERLRVGGSPFQYQGLPSRGNALTGTENEIRTEHFLVLDKGEVVRGAFTLVSQRFLIGGAVEQVTFLQFPLSEGSVNPAFAAVGLVLIKDALRRAPVQFSLGMGGIDRPLPQFYKRAFGFLVCEVPFFFQVLRPRAFLRNAEALRSRAYLRGASRIAAATGASDVAFGIVNAVRRLHAIPRRSLRVDEVAEFGTLTDEVWKAAGSNYSCLAIRDRETLNYLYPARDQRFHRLHVYENGHAAGWALVTDSQMRGHNHFGDMRLGAIVNCLAFPGCEDAVIGAASYYLRDRGVDLIVSNQLHPAWGRSLDRAGYLKYKSNFVFAASPELTARIKAHDSALERVHLNRGDGDGPYNL
ncbi:MAG: hypothetical protein ABSD64_13720 [Terriglobales bacterium]